jgi:ribonuclease J
MAMNGLVVVTLIIDEDGEVLGDPWCELRGLAETGRSNAPVIDVLEEDLSQFLGRAERKTLSDDDKLEEAIKRIVRQTCQNEIGKKPEVMIVVSRLA